MRIPQVDVDLSLPPDQRWAGLASFRQQARELVAFYLRDLGGVDVLLRLLEAQRPFLSEEHVEECRGVSRVLGVPTEDVLLANLYYDAVKFVFSTPRLGCTAFAVETDAGPLHARNLDWTTADGRLASQTIIVNFVRDGAVAYRTVTWPGFVGCLSGVAAGRFAVTLNAVLSSDPPGAAEPVCVVLRRALEDLANFDRAVEVLASTPLAVDCLLLVTGPKSGQACVIERTPLRSALRTAGGTPLVVTNDYRELGPGNDIGALAATSCGRFDRASAMLAEAAPNDALSCLRVLQDPGIQMGITVQQMVLSARTGEMVVDTPRR